MLSMTGPEPSTSLYITLEFVLYCNYDKFCQMLRLIVDIKPGKQVLECSVEYCLDAAPIGDISIEEVSPRYGSKSGWIQVTVHSRNLPAFVPDDVIIQVQSSMFKTRIRATSLSQHPTSTSPL